MVSKNWARKKIEENLWCYVFLAPTAVLFCMFTVYPVVASWVISFSLDRHGAPGFRRLPIKEARDSNFWNAWTVLSTCLVLYPFNCFGAAVLLF